MPLVAGAVESLNGELISHLKEVYRPCGASQKIESGTREPHLDPVT